MDVLARSRSTIETHHLVSAGETLLVAVSGGPDSLCLLHVLSRLRHEMSFQIHVAHLNHKLRQEADEEADYVAHIASSWGIPNTIACADVRALATEEHRSLEEAARVARYRFLAEVARASGANAVATGHNADDQVETVLMHFLRGSGLAGLRGMRHRAPWPEAACNGGHSLTLVRPLLDVPRKAIEGYVHEHGLQPRYDLSNLELTYFRNRLRHDLLPYLETYNPRLRAVLRRTAAVLGDDLEYLEKDLDRLWPQVIAHQSAGMVTLNRAALRSLDASPQRGLLRRALATLRPALRDVGWLHIENARRAVLHAPTGTRLTLPGCILLEIRYAEALMRSVEAPAPPASRPQLDAPWRALHVPGVTLLAKGGWSLHAEARDSCPEPGDDGRSALCVDSDTVGSNLILRWRQPGDRFQPRGMGGQSQSIKEYMIDAKIPRAERDKLPILVSERGIVWIVGSRASEVGAPGPATRTVLYLRLVAPAPHEAPL
ncbi:MAG: tRNA lysidine(34) synthetase TilS [Anaerolineae bacterium]